ncbi:uncharacterized protein HD556DRAFT_1534260 [Suillus plorans]|uniref:Uncharacterized protein n=1 Tax=Suillus plorans TaxID=116603 RepID=A0A9P7DQI5_9AGAM|nr:uncharacterized protein HD556DRAFT_1534260 [Suillus plorans]KAG1800412.1 hypothetical protein HD556DRAFT_1534260 [Suillus plorans]
MNSAGVSRKTLCSLKKLASLWRSDFHATATFEAVVSIAVGFRAIPWECMPPIQSVKCGLWWLPLPQVDNFHIQDCSTNSTLESRTPWSLDDTGGFHTFDPLQDLMVLCSEPDDCVTVTDAEQDHHVCRVEFRLASSQRPHPSAVCTSLECKHTFDAPGYYNAALSPPVICGDRVFIVYEIEDTDGWLVSGMFIQVINWRKGYVNRHKQHFLCQPDIYDEVCFYPVDEQKLVIVGPEGSIYLYTLQGLDGPPQCRIIYHPPKIPHLSLHDSEIIIHGHPSLLGKAARPGLTPSYVPSLESQIMVLEFLSKAETAILLLVIDMAIFSDMALHSDMPIEIPWSDWGPQYACYFPHHESYHISVFGSKMAYALPQDHIPDPVQRLERLSSEDYFYVHIWDFNKRVIARSESVNDPDSPDLHICKPGQIIDSFGEDIFSNRAYIATVCRTPFPTAGSRIFLEQDRLTVTWARHGEISIRVISPIQTEVGPDLTEYTVWLCLYYVYVGNDQQRPGSGSSVCGRSMELRNEAISRFMMLDNCHYIGNEMPFTHPLYLI